MAYCGIIAVLFVSVCVILLAASTQPIRAPGERRVTAAPASHGGGLHGRKRRNVDLWALRHLEGEESSPHSVMVTHEQVRGLNAFASMLYAA